MKYCKIIRLDGSDNYNENKLTLGNIYAAFPHYSTPDKYYIVNDCGDRWWVGNTINPERYGLSWRDMVKFYDYYPEVELPLIGV